VTATKECIPRRATASGGKSFGGTRHGIPESFGCKVVAGPDRRVAATRIADDLSALGRGVDGAQDRAEWKMPLLDDAGDLESSGFERLRGRKYCDGTQQQQTVHLSLLLIRLQSDRLVEFEAENGLGRNANFVALRQTWMAAPAAAPAVRRARRLFRPRQRLQWLLRARRLHRLFAPSPGSLPKARCCD
jgi:hypothetical protein